MTDFLEELFSSDAIESTSNYKPTSKNDGIFYRPDLKKVPEDKKARGYKAKLRFLPNVVTDIEWVKAYYEQARMVRPNLGEWTEKVDKFLGPFQIEKATLRFKNEAIKELNGTYDCLNSIDYASPTKTRLAGVDKYCPLTKIKFDMAKSSNVIMREKANMIDYSKKWYSYVLILEDEQQPELVGKVMIYAYGKQVNEKIEAEKDGVYGDKCFVQNLETGKDFYLIINELEYEDKNTGKKTKSPSYINSKFDNSSPISVLVDGQFKKPKLDENGKLSPKIMQLIQDMLLTREATLETYAPKAWTEEQAAKVNNIISYLSGNGADLSNAPKSSANSFTFDDDEVPTNSTKPTPDVAVEPSVAESIISEDKEGDFEFNEEDFDFDV